MKKLAIVIAMAMLAVSVSACNSGGSSSAADQSAPTESSSASVATESDSQPAGEDSAAGGEIRVVWWGGDTRHEATLKVIEMFEAANTSIQVTPEYMGGDSYWDKLATQVAGGNAPDVMQFGGNYPDYVTKDALLPLNDYFGNIIDVSNIDQGVIDSATMDGKTYGLCLGTNMLGIAYNKTMITEAGMDMPVDGASWEDLGTYSKELASKLPEGVFPMADNSGTNTNYIGFYARQQGASLYRDGATLMTPEIFENFFNMWAGWRADGVIPGAEASAEYSEESADTSSLVAGKVAMALVYSNQLVGFQEAMEGELDIMPLPDMEKNAAWVMPSQYFCLNNASDKAKQDAGATFINFFVNDPEAGKILGNDRGISASSEVREAVSTQAGETDQKIYKLYAVAADHTTPMDPNVPNDQEYTDIFKRICQEVAFDAKDAATAAQEAYDSIQAMIAKN